MRTPPQPRLSTVQALAEEVALLRPDAPPPAADAQAYAAAAGRAELSALCLSGGGIRSAAFSLGVIQSLARRGLLDRFDYLSTVSGGGFIGGWLDALARRDGVGAVQDMLRQETPPPQVRRLRDYTNYLTPRIGLLSLDTWAAAVLYLRNVMLNWLIFAPLFALCVLLAVFYRTLLAELTGSSVGQWALGAATLVLVFGTMRACLDLPSHRPRGPTPPPWPLSPLPPQWQARLLRLFAAAPATVGRDETDYASVRGISLFIVAPALIWAIVAPLALVHWYHSGIGTGLALPCTYAAAMLGGYALAAVWRWEWGLYGRNFGAWLLATVTSAAVLWLGIRFGRAVDTEKPEMLAVAGPLWLIVASALQALLHAGAAPRHPVRRARSRMARAAQRRQARARRAVVRLRVLLPVAATDPLGGGFAAGLVRGCQQPRVGSRRRLARQAGADARRVADPGATAQRSAARARAAGARRGFRRGTAHQFRPRAAVRAGLAAACDRGLALLDRRAGGAPRRGQVHFRGDRTRSDVADAAPARRALVRERADPAAARAVRRPGRAAVRGGAVDSGEPLLDARRVSQPADPRLPRHGAAGRAPQRTVHDLRSGRQRAAGKAAPAPGRAAGARDQCDPQPHLGHAARLGGAQGGVVHLHAARRAVRRTSRPRRTQAPSRRPAPSCPPPPMPATSANPAGRTRARG